MARAIWTGAVSFGLVSVPVGLYSATEQHEVRFHQFEQGTGSRVRYRRVSEETGEDVAYEDVVKGAEVDSGEYVVLTRDELESVDPGGTRTIDISDFVEAAEIDPIHFQKSYYLAPREQQAHRPYALLVRAMEEANRIGIATFVMRSKEYLAAIRPRAGVLVLETMFFADEIRDPTEEIGDLPVEAEVRDKDLDTAKQLIESMTVTWDPAAYRDTHTERVQELVEAKRKDEEIVTDTGTQPSGEVVDLLSALQASVDRTTEQRAQRPRSGGSSPGGGDTAAPLDRASKHAETPLDQRSKPELYDLAQERGIAGRSRMTRQQLMDALTDGDADRKKAS